MAINNAALVCRFWCVAAFFFLVMPLSAVETRLVAYVPTWCDVARITNEVPLRSCTHLNIAFTNATNDAGELSTPTPAISALIAAAQRQGVKVLVSLGGGAASEDPVQRARYSALIAPARRAEFVRTLAAYLATHRYDGLDVDLEGPAITADYGSFIEALAATLRAEGRLLTAALSSGYGGAQVPATALTRFDFINLMAYDATGPWSPDKPGPHASVAHARAEIAFWRGRGVAAERLVLGVPFYGYAFNQDRTVTALPFRRILEQHPTAAQNDQIGTLFYDGQPAIRAKAALAKAEGLGGLMIWSLDQDVSGPDSLLETMAGALGR